MAKKQSFDEPADKKTLNDVTIRGICNERQGEKG